jgi:hypothetical protein
VSVVLERHAHLLQLCLRRATRAAAVSARRGGRRSPPCDDPLPRNDSARSRFTFASAASACVGRRSACAAIDGRAAFGASSDQRVTEAGHAISSTRYRSMRPNACPDRDVAIRASTT